MKPDRLYKTTVVIWTDYDPKDMELSDLAREAERGDGYCSSQNTEVVIDQSQYPSTEFFDDPSEPGHPDNPRSTM